ncbi:hypothetical protein Tco_0830562 [Tanacetum coccineum]
MPTEMELTLEQTQQGVSYEVSNIRVNSFTMKMEILLEPTSNKLMVERFYTSAGNPVKEILLKLNLPDHRSILTDLKMVVKVPDSSWLTRFITTCSYPTDKIIKVKEFQRNSCHSDTKRLSRSDEVLKLKNFKKDATLKLSKSTNQECSLLLLMFGKCFFYCPTLFADFGGLHIIEDWESDEDMNQGLAEEYMDMIQERGKISWMVTDFEDPKIYTIGGVWSGEYMDHGFTKSMKELDRPWRCEVNGKYDVKRNLYIFSWEGNRIVMVPLKVTPQLPKPEAEVANEHIEKIQNLQIYKQHDDKISTLLFETTNKVGTLNACEEIIGFYDDEDVKGFNCELKTDFKCVHDLNVRDLDYGLILRMIIKNHIKFLMVNKDAIFISIENLRVVDKDHTTRCFGSWVDRWEYGRRVKKYESFRVDVKRNFIKDKVHREKVFEVDEALDVENSRASSFQVRGIRLTKTRSMLIGIGLHLRHCPRLELIKWQMR